MDKVDKIPWFAIVASLGISILLMTPLMSAHYEERNLTEGEKTALMLGILVLLASAAVGMAKWVTPKSLIK